MTLKLNTGENRREFNKMQDRLFKADLSRLSDEYAKLPANIRAALAKVAKVAGVAGVENERLDNLSPADLHALASATFGLRQKITAAYRLLAVATTRVKL